MIEGGCEDPNCSISTGIHDGLTFGSGYLDNNGFWEHACGPCAREWERRYPNEGECWPFPDNDERCLHCGDKRACGEPTCSDCGTEFPK